MLDDLNALGRFVTKEGLAAQGEGVWRYRAFLPVTQPENIVSLGEVMTPLISLNRMAKRLGVDEGAIPGRWQG